MKLARVHITNFQSIQDSTEFDIGDVTCLVGKNEAGKTALLKALYRLNPILETEGDFDPTEDYPRRAVSDYEEEVASGQREPAQVVKATFELEPNDVEAVEKVFGSECLKGKPPSLTLTKGYDNNRSLSGLQVDDRQTLMHLVEEADLPQTIAERLRALTSANEIVQVLNENEQTDPVQRLLPMLKDIAEHGLSHVVYEASLKDCIPRLLYFDEYYQLKGQDNVDGLRQRIKQKNLEGSDHPLLGLLELAGLDINQVAEPGKTETPACET